MRKTGAIALLPSSRHRGRASSSLWSIDDDIVCRGAAPFRRMSCVGVIRVVVSGWTYSGWRGSFYPKALPHAQDLAFASRQVDTIEINGTHYCLQRPDDFARWRDQSPEGFVFAVKGSRFITHLKQLHDIATPLANFFGSGVLRLEEKLGPFLWQFSSRFRFDRERLDNFLSLLPRDTEAAAALATRHDHRLNGRGWTTTECRRPLRHAIEIRHRSFLDPALVALLRRHKMAFVFADSRWVALCRGFNRRFCLSAAARRAGAVCQRL